MEHHLIPDVVNDSADWLMHTPHPPPPPPPLRERRDTMRVTKMSGKWVLFTHQSPARSTQNGLLHTGLKGCFQKEGTWI